MFECSYTQLVVYFATSRYILYKLTFGVWEWCLLFGAYILTSWCILKFPGIRTVHNMVFRVFDFVKIHILYIVLGVWYFYIHFLVFIPKSRSRYCTVCLVFGVHVHLQYVATSRCTYMQCTRCLCSVLMKHLAISI